MSPGTIMRAAAVILAAAALAPCAVAAEEIRIEAALDKTRAAVGEPILLTVIARGDEGVRWEDRSVADRLGAFEVLQVSGPAPLSAPRDGEAAEPGTQWVFRLAAFELGKLEIPEIQLRYTREGGAEAATAVTPVLHVEIVPTVAEEEQEPADVRHGFTLPPEIFFWALVAGGGLLLAAAAYAVWRRLRPGRKEAPAPAPQGPPPRPAYDRCIEALEALLREGLPQAGRHKEFHVRISEILKVYLGEVRGFDAVERTSWEVNAELAASEAPAPLRSEARRFLEACDAVKFAKHIPESEEVEATIAMARKLLELARPIREAGGPEVSVGRPAAAGGGAA